MQVGDLVTHKNLGGFGIITKNINEHNTRLLVMWMGADTPIGCWYDSFWLEAI